MAESIRYRRLHGYAYATNQDFEFWLRWVGEDNWTGQPLQIRAPGTPISVHGGWLELRSDALLTIKAGYAWDGPSGPRAWPGLLGLALGAWLLLQGLGPWAVALGALAALWVFVAWLARDSRDFMRASLVHDALYQLCRTGGLPPRARGAADQVMRQHALEDGMGRTRAWALYWGVRAFGKKNARRQERPPGERELVAP